jgi:hypothetical protein
LWLNNVFSLLAKKPKGRFWTGLSRLAEAFSLDWSPSSPRQPHSPLGLILIEKSAGSIAAEQNLHTFAVFAYSPQHLRQLIVFVKGKAVVENTKASRC